MAAPGRRPPHVLIKSGYFVKHSEKSQVQRIFSLGEEPIHAAAVVFEAELIVAHRKAHLGGLAGHADLVHQADEGRIGAIVEDDETGVDARALPFFFHLDCMGVAADIVGRLEQGDPMVAAEVIPAGQTGDAGADDCDIFAFHGFTIVWASRPHRGRGSQERSLSGRVNLRGK